MFPEADDDHKGRETNKNANQKLMYHRMGTTQDKDIVVAEFPENPNWLL